MTDRFLPDMKDPHIMYDDDGNPYNYGLDMPKNPQYKIGDKFKRSDYSDPKTYTIDKLALWRNEWIYGAEGQGWVDGWAWISEYNMKVV